MVFQAKANIEIFEVKGVPSAKDCTGYISIKIDGNSGPYDISAINTTTNSAVSKVYTNVTNGVYLFSGLCVGDYNIFVVDKNATIGGSATCKKTLMASIVVCQPFNIVEDAKSKIVCGDDKSGFIEVSIKGGVPPYKYLWSSGQTTEDISGLEGDKVYTLTVTDKQGCTASKGITVDGQKIQANLVIVKASSITPCDGIVELQSISSTGISSSAYKIQWSNPKVAANTITPKNLCVGKQAVTITSDEGCSFVKEFDVPKCQPKDLVLQSVENRYSPPVKQSTEYCNRNKIISILMSGGTPPISYTLKKINGATIQSGTVNYPQGGYFTYIDLKKYNDDQGDYIFEAEDMCGNRKRIFYDCKCIDRLSDFIKIDRCTENGDVEIEIDTKFKSDNPTIIDEKYTITWATPSNNTTRVHLKKTNELSNVYGTMNWTNSTKGALAVWSYENEFGCKFNQCTDFSLKNEGTTYCHPLVTGISYFNKNTNFKGLLQTMSVVTNEFNIYSECKNLCKPKWEQSNDPLVEQATSINNPTPNPLFVSGLRALGTYTPDNPLKPCASGKLKYPCMNNDGEFRVINIKPLVWFEDIDLTTVKSVVSPLFASTRCEADCYCYFPFGELLDGVFDNAYPYPKYFKTKKVLDETYKCEPVVPPVIPPNPVVIVGSNPPSSSSSPCNTDLIGEEKGNCKYDFICPATGVVVEKDVYVGNYCILAVFNSKFCDQNAQNKDLCSIKCKIDGFLRYDLVKYCKIDDLCGVGTPYITIKPDITNNVTGGSLPPQKGDGQKIKYIYKGEEVGACFPEVFFAPDPVSSKIANSVNVKSGNASAIVFPNPFQNQLTIKLESPKNSKIKIVLMNILGGIVQIQDVEANKGTNNFEFNFQDSLSQGMYYLQIVGEDYKLQYPIVHQ